MYFKNKLPRISDTKIKEGVFVIPQITQLIQNIKFEDRLSEVEKAAWKSFNNVTTKFLGNHKSESYRDTVAALAQSYKAMGCNMFLGAHFIDSHLDLFPENLGAVSDEHGERFNQEISTMVKRYRGKWSSSMLADYCWILGSNVPRARYSKNSSTVTNYVIYVYPLCNIM